MLYGGSVTVIKLYDIWTLRLEIKAFENIENDKCLNVLNVCRSNTYHKTEALDGILKVLY